MNDAPTHPKEIAALDDPWVTVPLDTSSAQDDTPSPRPLIEVAATGRHDTWTAKEIKILIRLFRQDCSMAEIADSVGRRLHATRAKVCALGLRRNSVRPWSEQEDNELRRRYGAEPVAAIASDLGRSPSAIYARAGTIGCADFQAPPWSDWEVDTLKDMLASAKMYADIAAHLGRGLYGVVSKAHDLGLASPNARQRWSADADAELIRLAVEEDLSARTIAGRLSASGEVRTRLAIKARLREMGIERDTPAPWREDEDDRLRAFYARGMTTGEMARFLPGRTQGGVRWRARHLGLRHPTPNGARQGVPWTSAEHALLRQLYGTTPAAEIARKLSRPKGSIYNEAFRLKLAGGYRHRWTDADDRELLNHSGSLRALCESRRWNYQVATRRRKKLLQDLAHPSGDTPAPTAGNAPMASTDDAHLPPSARRVHDTLSRRGPITIPQAAEYARCRPQTAYVALGQLRKLGLARKAGPKLWEAVPDKAPPPDPSPTLRMNESQQRVMTILADMKPRHTDEIVQASGLKYGTAYKALRDLRSAGRIHRPRAGWWLHPEASLEEVERIANTLRRTNRASSGKRQQILEQLDDGNNTLHTLRKAIGLTRQRVDQILKEMLNDGDVERTQNAAGVWVYTRPGEAPATTQDPASQARTPAVLLNLMPETGWIAARTLRDASAVAPNQFNRAFDQLCDAGLIEEIRRTKQRMSGCVRLTEAGRADMLRKADAERLTPVPMPLPAPHYAREIIRVIAGLGPQPTLALRVLCGLPDQHAGIIVQHMEHLGVIEEAPSYFHKTLRRYDLTRYSAIVVETDLEAPTRRDLAGWHERIAEALRHWTDTAGGQGGPVAITPARQAVLRLLMDEGPQSNRAITEKLGSEAKQPTKHGLLQHLLDIGLVELEDELYRVADHDLARAYLEGDDELFED